MTAKQVETHGEIIKWFCDNPERGVFSRGSNSTTWYLTVSPKWCIKQPYVINDKYFELRMAQADGKVVQYLDTSSLVKSDHKWYDVSIQMLFNMGIDRYRIKPDEPKFKVGDWVVIPAYGIRKLTHIFNSNFISFYGDIGKFGTGGMKLWEPKEGELCVFWYEKNNYYIRQYKETLCKIHPYIDELGDPWDNIAPLDFTQTLKQP